MADDREKVKALLRPEGDSEDVFFKGNVRKRIIALRERTAKEAHAKEREDHEGHCFRCGTKSKAEDVCG